MTKNKDDATPEATQENGRDGGWEAPVLEQLKAAKAMTLRERLIWLENATRTARFLQNAPIGEPPPFARKYLETVAEPPAPYPGNAEPRR